MLQEVARAELARLDPDGVAAAAADHVVDLDADASNCPACGSEIPRGQLRCPSCLLRLG